MLLLHDEYGHGGRDGVQQENSPGHASGASDETPAEQKILRSVRSKDGAVKKRRRPRGDGLGGGVNREEMDRRFLDWANAKLGVGGSLEGKDLNEWISDFQDRALALRGVDAHASVGLVIYYMENFWEHQKDRLVGRVGVSLSNLAVMIEGLVDVSHYTDMLFEKALELTPGHIEIAIYHAEFLIKAAGVGQAVASLVDNGRYDSQENIHEKIEILIGYRQSMPGNIVRQELIRLYLAYQRDEDFSRDKAGRIDDIEFFLEKLSDTLGKDVIIKALVTGSNSYVRELFQLISSYLDHIFSSGGATLLLKGVAGVWLWERLVRVDPSVSTSCLASMLGNHFAGESEDGSKEESTGLALDIGVLQDPRFLATNAIYSSAVMTQVAAILCKWESKGNVSKGASSALFYLVSSKFKYTESEWQNRFKLCLKRRGLPVPASNSNLDDLIKQQLPGEVVERLEFLFKEDEANLGAEDHEFCASVAAWFKVESSKGGIFEGVTPVLTLNDFKESLDKISGNYRSVYEKSLSGM
ncbi:MAG: hypothetical protein HQL59_02265 [Magnetococcales bacterium]|nr:hypothetical protein [Magnetococcales bacterium]